MYGMIQFRQIVRICFTIPLMQSPNFENIEATHYLNLKKTKFAIKLRPN